MKGPTHVVINGTIALGLTTLAHTAPDATMLLTGGAILTAKLPDQLEIGPVPHRGITHWWPTVLAVSAIAAYLRLTYGTPGLVAVGGAVGFICHVLADGATLGGIPGWRLKNPNGTNCRIWILPKSLRFEVGDPPEKVLAFAVSVGFAALIVLQASEMRTWYG